MLGKRKSNQPNERDRQRLNTGLDRPRKVYSYYASSPKPDRPKEQLSAPHGGFGRGLKLLPGALAVLVIIGSILYSFTLATRPSVTTLRKQPSPFRNIDEYAAKASELLKKNPRNRTKVSVQTYEVERSLLEAFPELQDVVLRLPVLGRVPSLVVSIRQPALLLAATDKTYVLDVDGIAVSEASQISAKDKDGLLLVRDQSGLPVTLGNQVLTQETVQFILDAAYQLKAKDYQISGLLLPISINELDIHIEGLPFFVKTDASGKAREQIGSFIAVHEHLREQGVTPAEYVDARLEEKVFYK